MSINDVIRDRCSDGRLFGLPPLLPSAVTKRAIFVSVEVAEVVRGPWDNSSDGYRFGQLRANLDAFTEGRLISIADHPYDKDKTAYLARLDPIRDRAWQIRSIDPKPAIRVFGHFAYTDTFVALTWRYRKELGGPRSQSWNDEIKRCISEWRKLFQTYQPFERKKLDEFVSENFRVV